MCRFSLFLFLFFSINYSMPNILYILLSLSTLLWKLQIHIHSLFLGTGFRGNGWIFPVRSRSFRDSVASSPKSRKSSRDLASTFRSSDFNSEKNTRRFKNLKKCYINSFYYAAFKPKFPKKLIILQMKNHFYCCYCSCITGQQIRCVSA